MPHCHPGRSPFPVCSSDCHHLYLCCSDVALDPIADVKAGREELRKFRSPNCAFLEVLVFGWVRAASVQG